MFKPYKLTLAASALLLSAFFSTTAAAATAPPKVAFVGDWLTTEWSPSFPANWISVATPSSPNTVLSQIPAALALKPSIIHIMMNQYWDIDSTYNLVTANVEEDLIPAIQEVQAAGIQVVIGIEPQQCLGYNDLPDAGTEIYAIATKYGVPVINYNGPFSNGNIAGAFVPNTPFFATPTVATRFFAPNIPTAAAFAIMTMEAQTSLATLNAQPSWLYLQDDTVQGNECGPTCWFPNVNTVSPGNIVQFYTVIGYTNGVSGVGFNTNFLTGTNGTWTSSNPLVGLVNQYGQFYAFNQGQTTVKFTLPNGVWNEWIMYVGPTISG